MLSQAALVEQFRLTEVNPSGAKFDQSKLDWLNGSYIRALSIEALYQRIQNFWHRPEGQDEVFEKNALQLIQERLVVLSEVDDLINFVFADIWDRRFAELDSTFLIPKKGSADQVVNDLTWAVTTLEDQVKWVAASLKTEVLASIAAAGRTNLAVLWPLRVALTGLKASPDVFDVAALLGKAETLRRVRLAIQRLQSH